MEDMLLADGFEKAFIGVGERCGQPDLQSTIEVSA